MSWIERFVRYFFNTPEKFKALCRFIRRICWHDWELTHINPAGLNMAFRCNRCGCIKWREWGNLDIHGIKVKRAHRWVHCHGKEEPWLNFADGHPMPKDFVPDSIDTPERKEL